ncbi:hypothetical protein J4T85_005500 [Sinorhizobium medicae]|uniref:hypothetical protein n=1 Tax=Sinorhizobium medicae TaxID=110321 RepID=UPI001AAED775|nr:hypothetical protein [Sinorhizobium medicae]MBO1962613.1 hypothetical protein [Sinorhizobium medicae]
MRRGGSVTPVGLRPPFVTPLPPSLILIDAESHLDCRRAFRSKTSFSRTYTAPKPTYRPAPSRPTTVYNRTTVVQQSSGGGMFSSIVGTVVGMSVYNWLFGEDEQQQVPAVAPVPTPAPSRN